MMQHDDCVTCASAKYEAAGHYAMMADSCSGWHHPCETWNKRKICVYISKTIPPSSPKTWYEQRIEELESELKKSQAFNITKYGRLLADAPFLLARCQEQDRLLKECEWSAHNYSHDKACCPICGEIKSRGHMVNCKLQDALKGV